MRDLILTAITPTPEQLTNWYFFLGLITGVLIGLVLAWLASEYGLDAIARRWNRRQTADVIDFAHRRRLSALKAISEDGR